MKKLLMISLSLLSLNIFAQDYIYKGVKNIEAKYQQSIEKNNFKNICHFEILDFDSLYGFPMLQELSFTNNNNQKFDFGNLLINNQNYADFENAEIIVPSSDTRWKVSNVLNGHIYRFYSLKVNFKNGISLKSVSFTDRLFRSPGKIYGIKNYKIKLIDCNNNVIFDKKFDESFKVSPEIEKIGTLNFSEY